MPLNVFSAEFPHSFPVHPEFFTRRKVNRFIWQDILCPPPLQHFPLSTMNIHKSVMYKTLLVLRQSEVFNKIGYPNNSSVKVMCAVVVDMARLETV